MNTNIYDLSMIGFLTIKNYPTGSYFSDTTIKWHVQYRINLGDGLEIEIKEYGSLEDIINTIWDEAKDWISENYPQYINTFRTYKD